MDKETLVKKLRDNGQRLTAIKSEIIDIFLEESEYLDVAGLRNRLVHSSDVSTIYRTVDALYNAGILDIIYKEDKRWFKLVEEHQHHHYVRCEKCGDQKELDFCPFKHVQSQVEGFDIKAHTFELIGVCSSCSEKEEKSDEEREH